MFIPKGWQKSDKNDNSDYGDNDDNNSSGDNRYNSESEVIMDGVYNYTTSNKQGKGEG